MWVGIGVGIGRNRFATGIFDAYALRVTADGGITEAGQCVDAVTGILLNASLLLIPSGYKGGKLYSEIPTNGNGDLIWTRGSDAFRTNASGLIQRVPWNLLQQSETFSNAYWTKLNATISADTTTAPNGTTTADSIIESSTNGIQEIYRTPAPTTAGTFTYSVYVKNFSGTRFLNLSASATTSSDYVSVRFSPLTESLSGVVVSGTFSNGSASYTAVGNGWYRVVLTFTTTSLPVPQIALSTDGSIGNVGGYGVQTYTGNGTSGLYIWGAQLIEGTTAQTYLPTTDRLNFPRLSYMYGSCPSALLEPQRTNLALWSEDITNTGGWTLNNVTATANTTTAPNGTTTADTLTATASTASHNIVTVSRLPATYTGSIYAKKGTHNFLQIWDGASQNAFANFDLNTGVLGTIGTLVTATITSVGNGWYRCSITFTPSGGGAFRYAMVSSSSAAHNESWTANGTETIFLWGGQTEVGAYPTTYIPTTSATATRVADSFSRNNIYTNGLISASGGTWFVELRNNISYVRDASTRIGVGDDSTLLTNSLFLNPVFGGGRIYIQKCVSGSIIGLYQTTTNTCKIAIKWNGTSADIFENGVKVVSATSFTATNMEWLTGSAGTPVFIQQMALFPTPLSDTDCATLTTL